MSAPFDLTAFYDDYPRIEEQFQATLDESLDPRGPETLYDIVGGLGLRAAADVLDVGCGEGHHALELARRFGFVVRGIDPVPRHVSLARQAGLAVGLGDRVAFEVGSAERLPARDGSVDLVWCRDVLVHVADLDSAYTQFRRVLRPGGRALVYQVFGTERLEPREAAWLFRTAGFVAGSADPRGTEEAIGGAGLRVDECLELGSEWGEYGQENSGAAGRRLLHAARLIRSPQRYMPRYGQAAYDIMLSDCLWHVYRMIGKLSARAYVLSRPA
jgi:SAM-dependent methyltransferase